MPDIRVIPAIPAYPVRLKPVKLNANKCLRYWPRRQVGGRHRSAEIPAFPTATRRAPRHRLTKYFHPLAGEFRAVERDTANVAAGWGKVTHKTRGPPNRPQEP